MTTGRQLVLLCDGTNNELSGRHADTHLVRLAELLRLYPDPNRHVYYDPGVGTSVSLPGTTMADRIRRHLDRINGLAVGRGLYDNVAEGYQFLMDHWRNGDQIFIFGFSRGAFTARSIGGLVNAFGIVQPQQRTLVPGLVSAYFATDSERRRSVQQQVGRLFAQGERTEQHPVVHFMGVWDTVASVGMPLIGLRISARPNLTGKCFRHVRQALALDEQRTQFMPRAYEQDDGPFLLADGSSGDVLQCWFRGAHCDVGGGYPYPCSEQARAPFAWMVDQALRCGLRLPHTAGHTTPDSEQAVLAALPRIDPQDSQRGPAQLSSQCRSTPLWALTGLQVRDTAHAVVDGQPARRVFMHAHPSVAQWTHHFPAHTVWGEPWSGQRRVSLLAALVALLWCMLQTGWALQPSPAGASAWQQVADALQGNRAFLFWQLGLPAACGSALGQNPGKALLWDLPLIAAYAWLLSHWVSWAFARCAGLVQVGQSAPRWLNRAGQALPLAVAADLTEDGLTALVLWLPESSHCLVVTTLRVLLGVAALAKVVGLLGCAALLASALRRRR